VGSDRLLVDGIRQRATLRELKRLSGQTKVGVAFIHTVPDIAYTFYKERTNKNITIQDFLKIRESPVERETHGLIELADAVVYNWTGRILYDETIRSMMRHLGIRTVGQS
jgi:hypothetical protein